MYDLISFQKEICYTSAVTAYIDDKKEPQWLIVI